MWPKKKKRVKVVYPIWGFLPRQDRTLSIAVTIPCSLASFPFHWEDSYSSGWVNRAGSRPGANLKFQERPAKSRSAVMAPGCPGSSQSGCCQCTVVRGHKNGCSSESRPFLFHPLDINTPFAYMHGICGWWLCIYLCVKISLLAFLLFK